MAAKKKRTRKKSTRKKTGRRTSANAGSRQPTPGFALVEDVLRRNKNATFQEVRDAGAAKGLKIAPILYGRVKALLGLVPMRKRGSKKAARRRATAASAAPRTGRGPGRPRKSNVNEGVVAAITELQRERDQMRDVLVRIRDLLDRVV